jgi:hypothetical protein
MTTPSRLCANFRFPAAVRLTSRAGLARLSRGLVLERGQHGQTRVLLADDVAELVEVVALHSVVADIEEQVGRGDSGKVVARRRRPVVNLEVLFGRIELAGAVCVRHLVEVLGCRAMKRTCWLTRGTSPRVVEARRSRCRAERLETDRVCKVWTVSLLTSLACARDTESLVSRQMFMFSALAVQHLLQRPVGEERREGADDVQVGAETHRGRRSVANGRWGDGVRVSWLLSDCAAASTAAELTLVGLPHLNQSKLHTADRPSSPNTTTQTLQCSIGFTFVSSQLGTSLA